MTIIIIALRLFHTQQWLHSSSRIISFPTPATGPINMLRPINEQLVVTNKQETIHSTCVYFSVASSVVSDVH